MLLIYLTSQYLELIFVTFVDLPFDILFCTDIANVYIRVITRVKLLFGGQIPIFKNDAEFNFIISSVSLLLPLRSCSNLMMIIFIYLIN